MKIFQNLGKELSPSLLALHALTSCDYTASFNRKGKVLPLKHLEKNETAQETFGCLGDMEEIDESILMFARNLFANSTMEDGQISQQAMFWYVPEKVQNNYEQHLNEVKKMDASSFPPCQCVLMEKIARTHYICRPCRSSIFPSPPTAPTPETSGWDLKITNTRSNDLTGI